MSNEVSALLKSAGNVTAAVSVDPASDSFLASVGGLMRRVPADLARDLVGKNQMPLMFATSADLVAYLLGSAASAFSDGALFQSGEAIWQWTGGTGTVSDLTTPDMDDVIDAGYLTPIGASVPVSSFESVAAAKTWSAANNIPYRTLSGFLRIGDVNVGGHNASYSDAASAITNVVTDSAQKRTGITAGNHYEIAGSSELLMDDADAEGDYIGHVGSVSMNYSHATGGTLGGIGLYGRAVINGGTGGEARGIYAAARLPTANTGATIDGQLFGAEIKVSNNGGTDQGDPLTAGELIKSNVQFVGGDADGGPDPQPITSAIQFGNYSAGWHYGAWMRQIKKAGIYMRQPIDTGARAVEVVNDNSGDHWAESVFVAPAGKGFGAYDSGGTVVQTMFKEDGGAMKVVAPATIEVHRPVSRADLVTYLGTATGLQDGDEFRAGGHWYRYETGATTIADMADVVPVEPFHFEQWGVVPQINNGLAAHSGNYSAEIKAAYDYVSGLGGGRILAGRGVIPFSDPIIFEGGNGVVIQGEGRGTETNGQISLRKSAGTRLFWTGTAGSTAITFTSDAADTGANLRMGADALMDLMLDGKETGSRGLELQSVTGFRCRINTGYWTNIHFKMGCLSNGVSGAAADTQDFDIDFDASEPNTTAEADALVLITGNGTENTSIGKISSMRLMAEKAAVCAHFEAMDGTFVERLHCSTRTTATGDGGKVFLHADDTLPAAMGAPSGKHCRHVTFGWAQLTEGMVAKATIAGSRSSEDNRFLSYSLGNGSPLPTVEAGATINGFTDTGAAL